MHLLHALTRCFFFNETATTEIYTLSLHDALPIFEGLRGSAACFVDMGSVERRPQFPALVTANFDDTVYRVWRGPAPRRTHSDRKSTRLNSSHSQISYAVFCLKKKKIKNIII